MQRLLYGVLLVGVVFDVYEGLYLLPLIDARKTLGQDSLSGTSKARAERQAAGPGSAVLSAQMGS